jgi:hypothetical protein
MAHLIEFPHHGWTEIIGGVKVPVDDRTVTVGGCSTMLYNSVFMCPDPLNIPGSVTGPRGNPLNRPAIETIQSS